MSEFGEKKLTLQSVDNKSLTWIDIQKPTREKLMKLSHYPFHELNIADCLSKIQIPKLDSYDDHVFVILNFPIIYKDEDLPHPAQLAIFAGNGYLVTVQQEELKPISEAFEACKANEKFRDTYMGNSSGYLLHSIIDMMVDDLLHILIKIEGNLDDIEDIVFDPKTAVAREISILRREITTLRRLVFPLKRTVTDLSKEIQRLSEEDLTLYFDNVKDHIDKVIEALDESNETIDIFKDTDFMLSTEKSNKILAVLTILFTLSIPATVIGAYYGMNINLPGGIETGSATFLGEYTSFIIIMIAAVIPALVMIYWFKREAWLKY
ncbi:MAG: magnesium transporter CorA family protein [Nitrososphaerota archaeon]|jgi:magnesium transporter|nr:magnesium transporter CorA family protein [Nitrososphaeraceae archaeon]